MELFSGAIKRQQFLTPSSFVFCLFRACEGIGWLLCHRSELTQWKVLPFLVSSTAREASGFCLKQTKWIRRRLQSKRANKQFCSLSRVACKPNRQWQTISRFTPYHDSAKLYGYRVIVDIKNYSSLKTRDKLSSRLHSSAAPLIDKQILQNLAPTEKSKQNSKVSSREAISFGKLLSGW